MGKYRVDFFWMNDFRSLSLPDVGGWIVSGGMASGK
jgi:hypothetical protein